MKTNRLLLLTLGLGLAAHAAAPSLQPAAKITNGVVRLTATGTAGSAQVLELSTDLLNWSSLSSVSLTNGTATFEVAAGEGAFHAYRLRSAAVAEIPAPWKVAAAVNGDFRKTLTIGRAGGSFSFLDDNNVTYQLTIPSNAVFASEDITFNVVNDVTSWPLAGKFAGGVKIEPDGLRLLTPATLTITLPAAIPTNSIAVAWHEAGAEFHANPSKVAGAVMTVPLSRLGGYGLATLGAGDSTNLLAHPPTGFDEQFDQQLALGVFGFSGPAIIKNDIGKKDLNPNGVESLTLVYNLLIRPDLVAAANDDSLVDHALARYEMWKTSLDIMFTPAELTPLNSRFADAILLGGKAIYSGINRAADKCEQHQIQALGKLVHFGQLMEAALWSASFTAADKQLFRQKVKNCATFDLNLDCLVTTDSKVGNSTSRVRTHWVIEFKDDALTDLSGSGSVPMSDVTFNVTVGPPCFLGGITPRDGGAQLPEFTLVPNLRDLFTLTNRPPASGISVLFNPFLIAPAEGITVACPPGPSIPFNGFWTSAFGVSYKYDLTHITRGQIYKITGWGEGSGDVLGRKHDVAIGQLGDGGVPFNLDATWELRHTPIPFR